MFNTYLEIKIQLEILYTVLIYRINKIAQSLISSHLKDLCESNLV